LLPPGRNRFLATQAYFFLISLEQYGN